MRTNIFTNIGYQSFKYKNKGYENDFIPIDTFRSATKEILENFEDEKDNLEITELTPLLEENPYCYIYIFYADNENNAEGDTVNAALILGDLIKEKYPHPETNITLVELDSDLANDKDSLINVIVSRLKTTDKIKVDSKVIYFDAGGITQEQRDSLRYVLEMNVPKENFKQISPD